MPTKKLKLSCVSKIEDLGRKAPKKFERKPYPIDSVPPCGDAWCLNGPPGKGHSTYFLCENCTALAPDAIALGYATKPKTMKRGDREKINRTVLSSMLVLSRS